MGIADDSSVRLALNRDFLHWVKSYKEETMQEKSPVNCQHFFKDTDGFWKSTQNTDIASPAGFIRVAPGMIFKKGRTLAGVDVVALLEDYCSE